MDHFRASAALVLLLTNACSPSDEAELLVDLRTDFVPGVEFTGVRTELFDGTAPIGEEARGRVDALAFWPDDFVDGTRVGEFRALGAGEYLLRVGLLDGGGQPVTERRVRVSVQGRTAVTVLATRSCAGVTCPTGDDPALTACLDARCVDPRCTPESAEFCPPPACDASGECTAMSECAVGVCIGGSCLIGTRPGSCADTEFCHPDRDCQPLPDPFAPTTSCPGRCEGCEPCGSGGDAAFAPTADAVLVGGTHRFASFSIPTGITVTVTGTEPLIILSRAPVDIGGVLELSGSDGDPGRCGLSGEPPPGGAGGGGGGGDGGAAGICCAPNAGVTGAGPGGGTGGVATGPGSGGGGAGHFYDGHSAGPDCDDATAGMGGVAYDAFASPTLLAGSGGGGASVGVSDNGLGGGGGGGGGAIEIIAPEVRVAGTIRANGGAGGAAPTCDGGSGGGGSGGTVWLRSGLIEVGGSIEVAGGAGGATTRASACGSARRGGDGSPGVVRLDADELLGAVPAPVVLGGPPCDEAMCR